MTADELLWQEGLRKETIDDIYRLLALCLTAQKQQATQQTAQKAIGGVHNPLTSPLDSIGGLWR